jgi:cytoskeletal protein CcmA (bactofilin family)
MAGIESTLVNSIIGVGTTFKGQITVSGLMRVDGDLNGSIRTSGRVIIGRTGRADCTIDASTVVIGGVFRGTIYASEKVIALESAIILGNIFAPRIIVEAGVLLDGAMHIRGTTRRDEYGKTVDGTSAERGEGESAQGTARRRRGNRRRVPMENL